MTRAEILDCLTDRPCDSCKFHESGKCERWDCVFEEKPDDVEADAISRVSVLDTLDNTDEFMDEERTVETYKALLKECYEVLPSVTPKVAECEDVISRQVALDAFGLSEKTRKYGGDHSGYDTMMLYEIQDVIEDLPTVIPKQKIGHCKDCKWWKDSDGSYRRGIGAESQCPINGRVVFEGNGYCYMFEPREGSDKE